MAEETLTLNDQMFGFFQWMLELGEEKTMEMIRGKIRELEEFDSQHPGLATPDGYRWDPLLAMNDGPDQWHYGGDCNLCRKVKYCKTKCRANRLLKAVVTPFLYEQYLEASPDALAKEVTKAAKNMTPEQLLEMAGVEPNDDVKLDS